MIELADGSSRRQDGRVDVSFIVAVRDGLPFVEEAIRSGLDQTGAEVEIVVVDDGSVDGTGALLGSLAANEPRLRVLHADHATPRSLPGPSHARNLAIGAARGRWIAILDADDLLVADRTRTLLDLADVAGIDVIADNPIPFTGTFDPAAPAMLERGAEPYLFEVGLVDYVDRNRMLTPGVKLGYLKPMFRREFVRAAALRYDETVRIGEDFLFCLDALAAGARFLVTSYAGYGYRRSPTSLSHRLHAPDIRRLDTAFAGFVARVSCGDRRLFSSALDRACGAYRRSLRTALAAARVVESAQSGRWPQSVATALRQPGAWPFLAASLFSASSKRLGQMRLVLSRPVASQG